MPKRSSVGTSRASILKAAEGRHARACSRGAQKDGKFEAEAWRVRKDGTRFWANALIDPICDEAGTLLGFTKVTRDISERCRVQALEWSRLSAMGTMALTLAHELNQPLTAITNFVRGGRRLLADETVPAEVAAALDGAEKSAAPAHEIIRWARDLCSTGEGD